MIDCDRHGPGTGCELLLVEGDSALASVSAVRDARNQAVLAFQGKPLNAWQASEARVAAHAQYRLLAQALGLSGPTAGLDEAAAARLPFERVALLFDPDADGIHIGALMVLYVRRWLPLLIEQGRLLMLRAPMFELVSADGEVLHADHPAQCHELAERLRAACGGAAPQVQAFRGLGGIAPSVLRERCVDPATRAQRVVGAADVQSVLAVFGGMA